VLPSWCLCLTGFHCASEALTPTHREDKSPSGSSCPLAPRESPPSSLGNAPGDKGGGNLPSLQSQTSKPPSNVEITSWHNGHWGRLAGGNVYCAGTDPVDSCPKAEPEEQRGLILYTLATRLQKQKAKLNPHMAACDFIGYFISPVLCDLHVSVL
jgi:hypothetical protein